MVPSNREGDDWYEEHFSWLVEMATARGLTEAEAEHLANEILTAAVVQLPRIEDPRVWLGAALNAALSGGGSR